MTRTATGGTRRATPVADDVLLQDLLVKTSRTFALAIPLLPQPTRREVTIAYLLFRIADTFEDASVLWERSRQIAALEEFSELLGSPEVEHCEAMAERWLEVPPSDHAGYLELLARAPAVLGAFRELSKAAREIIAHHTVRTAGRMAGFVGRSDERGNVELATLDDLREYCYAVAGIVGEVCTDLFLLDRSHLTAVAGELRQRAALFGEGLQLVNILKDSSSDAKEGRFYIPAAVERSEVLALARDDLRRAAEYVLTIQRAGGPDGIVAFTGLPVELARATLDRVEERGAGSKLTRPEVFAIYDRLQGALAAGRPALEA